MAEADAMIQQDETVPAQDMPLAQDNNGQQSRGRWLLMFVVPVLIIVLGGGYWYSTRGHISTDNAYIRQDIVSVSSDVAGRIVEVAVRENQQVKAGDLLFRVDAEPYRVALALADAEIAAAQVKVVELQTQYRSTNVDIAKARKDIAFAQTEYERQAALAVKGFTTRTRLDSARHQLDVAKASLHTAQAEAAEARSALATGGQVPGVNPELAHARARREQVLLDLERTEVRAPVSGMISQASRLQVGQMLVTGLPAISIVANGTSWVVANFKETQLEKLRRGQKAVITVDAYGDIKLKGHIASIGGGTGSQFSVLPAQNANGNWAKVTQRVPIRIAIDEASPRPLITGLSSKVIVDVGN